MSLDIVMLASDGTPEVEIGIGVDAHVRLMRHVESRGLVLLSRMGDYYEDADYSPEEASSLLREVAGLARGVRDDAELSQFLAQFCDLAERAIKRETGLAVLAD